jgi:hypothetical protein
MMPLGLARTRARISVAYNMIIGVLAWLMLEFAGNIVFRFDNANSVMF